MSDVDTMLNFLTGKKRMSQTHYALAHYALAHYALV